MIKNKTNLKQKRKPLSFPLLKRIKNNKIKRL